MGKMADRIAAAGANRMVTKETHGGGNPGLPPSSNTGVIQPESSTSGSEQIGSDRGRVNLSVPPGVDAALSRAARLLGMTKAQVALHLVLEGLPGLERIVSSVDQRES